MHLDLYKQTIWFYFFLPTYFKPQNIVKLGACSIFYRVGWAGGIRSIVPGIYNDPLFIRKCLPDHSHQPNFLGMTPPPMKMIVKVNSLHSEQHEISPFLTLNQWFSHKNRQRIPRSELTLLFDCFMKESCMAVSEGLSLPTGYKVSCK